MRKIIYVTAICAATVISSLIACSSNDENSKPASKDLSDAAMIDRGNYLVSIMGCDDCHSPKRMGAHGPEVIPETRLSGYIHSNPLQPVDSNSIKKGWMLMNPDLTSAVGPWGQTFAANLTSDDSGIGTWTVAQFKKAIREGKLKGMDGSRPILPPMPWQNFSHATDSDLEAIFAFLKSTKPVNNVVPGPIAFKDLK